MIQFYDICPSLENLRKWNDNLRDVIDFYYDSEEDSKEDSFSDIFPELIYLQHKNKCIKAARELKLMIEDDYVHFLPVLHQYALYCILTHISEVEADLTDIEPEVISSKNEVIDCDFENEITKEELSSPDFYLEWCFKDYDFMTIPQAFILFKTDKNAYESLGLNLDNYLDLMPDDIRNEYLNLKSQK